MDKIKISSIADVLDTLENQLYLKGTSDKCGLSTAHVKSKISEFSEFFNSVGRLSLYQCDKSEGEEFISLLLSLKRNIKYALSEIGRSHNNKVYNFVCGKCGEHIDIDTKQNFWTCLQNHEHFEELFVQFLNGNLNNVTENMATTSLDQNSIYLNPIPSSSNAEYINENTDSGIDNEMGEADQNENSEFLAKHDHDGEDVNSFRFNFVLSYDSVIEKKVYPEGFIKAIRKIDKIREYTIQRAGPSRGICLLCSCDLITKTKITKFSFEDHCMGHRHLRHANTLENVNNLKKYHEFWLNLDIVYQAHQVYFKPLSSVALKCDICNSGVTFVDTLAHIQADRHKKQVLQMFEKKINVYYLVDLQVQVYGVTSEQIGAKNREVKKPIAPAAKAKAQIEKTDSDSSPSSDSKDPRHITCLIKSVENPTSENVLDLIPNRFREHLKYIKNNGDTFNCDLCKLTLPKNVEQILKHIKLTSHIKASDVTPKKYNYYCEICNIRISDEASWKKHFTDGPNKHANMAESRKDKTTEYECTKCYTVIYGDQFSLIRHLSVSLKRDRRSKEIKLPPPVQKLFKTNNVIEVEAVKLTFEANDAMQYNRLTKECCSRLETTLSVAFENCKAYPFGSRISGLGDQYSDLDVFIDTGGMYDGYDKQDPLSQVQLVRKSASILCKHKDEFQDVLQIPTARTPIVKVYHKITEIECDLSFRHGLSVENTKFLRFCIDLQPITQPFVLLLKKWSQHNNFTEHISTYALALMAIFYLQINDYLLSVKKLRELNPQPSLVINGWETINYTTPLEDMKSSVTPYTKTVPELLKDFFAYYAKFKYSVDVVCPLLGRTILKKQFQEGNLPVEMNSYVLQLQGEEPEQFRDKSSMCIQDPFDLSHNLTKACQAGTVNKFKTLCDLSYKHLDSFK